MTNLWGTNEKKGIYPVQYVLVPKTYTKDYQSCVNHNEPCIFKERDKEEE